MHMSLSQLESRWWTGRPGVLRFMGSQRVGHDWETELNWTDGSSSGHVWMWELDCEESWAPKNWCFWTVVLQKTLESPLDCNEIQPVHPKENQSLVFTGRTDAEAETPIFWPPHEKGWLIGKTQMLWGIGDRRTRDDRGWDGWMASPTRWTWVWVNSRSWWWTGRAGVLRFMGSQRVWHDWATELNWDTVYLGFPGGSDGKEFTWNAEDLGWIPRSGIPPRKGNGCPLQISCL